MAEYSVEMPKSHLFKYLGTTLLLIVLDLSLCSKITGDGLKLLRALPLESLILDKVLLTDDDLSCFDEGQRISSLLI